MGSNTYCREQVAYIKELKRKARHIQMGRKTRFIVYVSKNITRKRDLTYPLKKKTGLTAKYICQVNGNKKQDSIQSCGLFFEGLAIKFKLY